MSADISQLAAALNHPDASERSKAAEQLAGRGSEARDAAVDLVRACGDPAEEVRQWATAALEELGPPRPADVATLARLVDDENPDVGYWAATLLGRLEGEAAPAVAALTAVLSGSAEIQVRQRCAWALGKIGLPAAAAVATLRQAAAGDDPRLARLAQRAIDQIGG